MDVYVAVDAVYMVQETLFRFGWIRNVLDKLQTNIRWKMCKCKYLQDVNV